MLRILVGAGIAQSVQRLATGWKVRGSNPDGGEIFRTRPDRPWGPPTFLYNGYRVFFPAVKQPERGVDQPPHLAPRLKKRVVMPLLPLWAFLACYRVNFTHFGSSHITLVGKTGVFTEVEFVL